MSALHALSTETLRRLAAVLTPDGSEVSVTRLEELGLDDEAEAIRQGLDVLPAAARLPVIRAILAERDAHGRRSPRLVWTGPEADGAEARRSVVVLRELFESARQHVLIAGYSFDHGVELFEPLRTAMVSRGVAVDVYLNVEQTNAGRGGPGVLTPAEVAEQAQGFLRENWPWSDAVPTLWYDRRVLDGDVFASLHAKCAVVDATTAYVTSANFTERGTERNVEVGVVLPDAVFARRLAGQFAAARAAGWFVRVASV